MSKVENFTYFEQGSFSELFAEDITDGRYGFILNYPSTAAWAVYPNHKQYFIQDGSEEATKASYEKLCQQEPWKNLSVLGDSITGVIFKSPRNLLINYWQEQFGFKYNNIEPLERKVYLDYLNQSKQYDKLITLFPFDSLLPAKHAVDPDVHYHLLSKTSLAQTGVQAPKYEIYDVTKTAIDDLKITHDFPYLIKVSHGLSGEGTYIIKSASDLEYCLRELNKYYYNQLLKYIIVSDFVKNEVKNYCVQFYVSKSGKITLIGATGQMVTTEGKFLGGLINYQETDISKFFSIISKIGNYAHEQGYFGVIGSDVLEDKDGELHVIDINYRVNGSTPLCLQRHRLLKAGKAVAKYSGDYRMNGTLDEILVTLKPELERKDFLILSALEKVKYGKIYTDIYGIVAGADTQEMLLIEEKLQQKGLKIVS
jgi:hypothetical protein